MRFMEIPRRCAAAASVPMALVTWLLRGAQRATVIQETAPSARPE
jgi:hypothetical protein